MSCKKRVLVGMSGGIDSSVAAYLLKQQGYDVVAVTMTVWNNKTGLSVKPDSNSCFSPDRTADIEKTRIICDKIGIPHQTVDLSRMYESVVLKNFKDEYLNGRTPNPCVWCNPIIKFGAMVDNVRNSGLEFDYFATGHYAVIKEENGRFALYKGADPVKDQSYFLYRLSQKQLSATLFPLGNLTKKEVREIDLKLGFHGENQSESQDFYSGHYTDLLDVDPKEGDIVDIDGKVLGKHKGMWNYTIGQRKGLGVSAPYPLYVVSLDPVRNLVVVGPENLTNNRCITASMVNWVSVDEISKPIKATAKIRSTSADVPCTVTSLYDGRLKVDFDNPVKAATCGQSLVVYEKNRILAGGIIDTVDSFE